jgi:hypothetical protein
MSSEIIAVTPETLPAIMWQNQPVITTELLAEIYGTAMDNINKNFERNKSRFIEGVHYFLLKGADLKAFKNCPTISRLVQIGKRSASLYLWTERGTVRHAKILDTDNAWAVQDRLEDFYFTKNQPKPYGLIELESINKTQWGILSAMVSEISIASGKEGTTKTALWSRFNNHFKIGGYKELPAIKFDDAVTYLEAKRDEYNRGFTLAVVKKDDLLALGYDSETKMFAVQALPAPQAPQKQAEQEFTPCRVSDYSLTHLTIEIPMQNVEFILKKFGGMVLYQEDMARIKGVLKA